MRKVYIEKEIFSWDRKQDKAFNAIKNRILTNAIASPDPNLQFHLIFDASFNIIGGILF